jgi:hypothetical protein
MTTVHLKDHLAGLHATLLEVETHARKLPNHNFADIVKSAHSKVHQLMTHPDLNAVHEHHGAGSKDAEKVEAAAAGALFTTL